VATNHLPIVGGEAITRGQFPALVAIILPTGAICTGALIAPDRVLTAAHCLQPAPPGIPDEEAVAASLRVYLNAIHVCGPDPEARSVGVRRVVSHPGYAFPDVTHDVGGIWLAEPMVDLPLPVNLVPALPPAGAPVTAVGFGVENGMTFEGCTGRSVPDQPTGACADLARTSDDQALCLDLREGQGPCAGDSGGPILADLNGILTVVAVVSAGDVACAAYARAVRTSAEAEFIQHVVAGNFGLCQADGTCEPGCAGLTDDPDCEPEDAATPDGAAVSDAGSLDVGADSESPDADTRLADSTTLGDVGAPADAAPPHASSEGCQALGPARMPPLLLLLVGWWRLRRRPC